MNAMSQAEIHHLSPVQDPKITNEVVLSWVAQILDPSVLKLVEAVGDGQIEIRLYANRAHVGKAPVILLNASDGLKL